MTEGKPGPGPGFYVLGSVGRNTFYGTVPKTAFERLRHYAATARADAAKKPVPEDMKLHYLLKKHRPSQRSFAPPARQRAQPQNMAPAPPGAGNATGLLETRHSVASQTAPPANSQIVRGEPLTGYRAIVAAAHAKVAAARAKRGASRHPGRSSRPGASAAGSMPSVAPIGPANGLNARFAGRAGGMSPQFTTAQMRDGSFAPFAQTGPGHAAPSAISGAPDDPRFTPPAISESDLRQALDDLFYWDSRLPPRGTQAFDPRLTPAWPGLKLPG